MYIYIRQDKTRLRDILQNNSCFLGNSQDQKKMTMNEESDSIRKETTKGVWQMNKMYDRGLAP